MVHNRNIFKCLEKGREVNTAKLESTENKKIYFTRFAESMDGSKDARMIIMNEDVSLPEKYAHQFVFAEWDLEKEQLSIYSEYKKVRKLIKKQKFEINL